MRVSILFLNFLLFAGCAYQTSKNRIATHKVTFEGGLKNNDIWQDSLDFERISWYRGATLTYDLLIGEVKTSSPFRKWLSDGERSLVSGCEKLYVSLVYANAYDSRSVVTLSSQIEDMGFKRLTLPVFSGHLTGHATFPDRNLGQHRPMAFCKTNEVTSRKDNNIEVPGFISTEIKL